MVVRSKSSGAPYFLSRYTSSMENGGINALPLRSRQPCIVHFTNCPLPLLILGNVVTCGLDIGVLHNFCVQYTRCPPSSSQKQLLQSHFIFFLFGGHCLGNGDLPDTFKNLKLMRSKNANKIKIDLINFCILVLSNILFENT